MWPTGKHVIDRDEWLEIWKPYGILDTDVNEFLESLRISATDQKAIMNEQQRTAKWHQYRAKRMTASNFGSIVGVNPYSSPNATLKNMLWPRSFSCAAVEWGTKHEATAASLFQDILIRQLPELEIASVQYPGLVICEQKPYFGCSPDGIVVMKSGKLKGLEIKCPFGKKLYPSIPPFYYAQIQGTCGLLGLESYFFQVWTPEESVIEEYAFDREYYFQFLIPRMEKFYFEKYLPLAILRQQNKLPENSITPIDPENKQPIIQQQEEEEPSEPLENNPPAFV